MRSASFMLLFVLAAAELSAQWRLDVRSIDALALPRVRMQVVLVRDGMPYARAGEAAWSMTQNGLPVDLHTDCPDSGWISSLALVLDNSGTMSGLPLQGLKDAAKSIVDSLRPNDEAAVVAFGAGVTLVHDFTSRKDSLRTAIDTMKAGGGTPLIDAIIFALQRISTRAGRKALVILTDGIDNSSSGTYQQVRDLAAAAGVKLYTIGFGSGAVSETMLQTLAKETGARFFRVFAAPQLQEVFASIATELSFPGCVLWWDAPSCTDSVRFLHLEAAVEGRTVAWDSLMRFPWRPDTLALRVTAPASVDPGGYAIAYIGLQPCVHTGLLLSFRFLFRFDPNLLEVSPVIPVTLGTISQNTAVSVRALRPGVLACTAELIQPAFATGNLMGIRLTGLAADSSRPVVLSIDSVEFAAGCENTVIAYPDTIEVCQCWSAVPAWVRGPGVVTAGKEAVFDVCVADTALKARTVFTSLLRFDPSVLTLLSVEALNIASGADLRWELPSPGLLRVLADRSFAPSPGTLLYRASFRAAHDRHPSSTAVVLPSIRVWARCCPAALPDTSVSALIDGSCAGIVTRSGTIVLAQNSPNPARDRTDIAFSVAPRAGGGAREATLYLYDVHGRPLRQLYCGPLPPGRQIVTVDVSNLEPGAYLYLLQSGGESVARTLVVLR